MKIMHYSKNGRNYCKITDKNQDFIELDLTLDGHERPVDFFFLRHALGAQFEREEIGLACIEAIDFSFDITKLKMGHDYVAFKLYSASEYAPTAYLYYVNPARDANRVVSSSFAEPVSI